MSRVPQEPVLEFFVVRSSSGQFFRSKGQNYSRSSWVDDIKDAKVYTKIGPAKAQATWWTRNFPDFGVPDVVVLEARIAGTAKHKVSDKLKHDHAKLVVKIREYDEAISELDEIISESNSDVVCKSLTQQVADLRARRSSVDREASGLMSRITKVENAINTRSQDVREQR